MSRLNNPATLIFDLRRNKGLKKQVKPMAELLPESFRFDYWMAPNIQQSTMIDDDCVLLIQYCFYILDEIRHEVADRSSKGDIWCYRLGYKMANSAHNSINAAYLVLKHNKEDQKEIINTEVNTKINEVFPENTRDSKRRD